MQFAFTPEQEMIRETAIAYAEEHGTPERVRAAMDSADGFDHASWRTLTTELGFGGIAAPESYGGAGLGTVELASVAEMLGRTLLPSPFLASIGLAATAIAGAGSESQRAALLPDIIGGASIATLAHCGERGGVGADSITMRIDEAGRLAGDACFVPYGHVADTIVVAARDPSGTVVLAVLPRDADGLVVEPLTMMDLTRPMARLRCDGVTVPAERRMPGADAALARTLDLGAALIAADCVGACDAILAATVAYAKERVQFGRPIGSFQAIKHRIADMMVAAEAARSLAWYAACALDETPATGAEASSVAKVECTAALRRCAGDMIQLHGGIGFTWEHAAHLYFKRARANATMLGDAAWHRERILQTIERGLIG